MARHGEFQVIIRQMTILQMLMLIFLHFQERRIRCLQEYLALDWD
jgi:hypothetical protein